MSVRSAGGGIVDLAASPDGSLLAASRPGDEGLLLMDAKSLEPLPFTDDVPASEIAFSPDSSRLVMAVNQWTDKTAALSGSTRSPSRPYDMPDGALSQQQLGGFPEGASVEYDLDFSADGRHLVAAVDRFDAAGLEVLDTTATVWDLADPAEPESSAWRPGGAPGPQAESGRDAAVRRGHRHPGCRPVASTTCARDGLSTPSPLPARSPRARGR